MTHISLLPLKGQIMTFIVHLALLCKYRGWDIFIHKSIHLYDTPTQNAATQNSPADLTSLDLYWRAPPNPDSPQEYQQLPQQIQFW